MLRPVKGDEALGGVRRRWAVLWRPAASVLSGLLLAASFPPASQQEVAWVGLVPLLFVCRYTLPRSAFKWGVVAGLAFWLPSISWLLRLSVTGGAWPIVTVGWLLLAAYCSLYVGAFASTSSRVLRAAAGSGEDQAGGQPPTFIRRSARNLGAVVGVALLWVGFEYGRSTLFSGFAWNGLGVSQFRDLPVIQLAEWGGVYAVSALLVAVNTAATLMLLRLVDIRRRAGGLRLSVELMAVLILCAWALIWGARAESGVRADRQQDEEVRVAAIQPNIPQLKKWDEDFVSSIYQTLRAQTECVLMNRDNLDMIVWPETAVPHSVRAEPNAAAFVGALAREGVPMLIGSLDYDSDDAEAPSYNSAFLFATNGLIVQEYRKRHLVPFGEYLPLDKRLTFLQRIEPLGYTCTPGAETTVFHLRAGGRARRDAAPLFGPRAGGERGSPEGRPAADATFSVLICFEDTVASLAREAVRKGAGFLVVITNDAWFNGSAAKAQHMSHCVFRCVENRVDAVRAANTGITCFIDRTGRIVGPSGADSDSVQWITEAVRARAAGSHHTFYTRYGDWPFAFPCGILSAAVLVGSWVRERRGRKYGGEEKL